MIFNKMTFSVIIPIYKAEKYLVDFCKKTHTDRRYVHSWLPIVAAARMTKHIPEEKELLESMIDVCDYQ